MINRVMREHLTKSGMHHRGLIIPKVFFPKPRVLRTAPAVYSWSHVSNIRNPTVTILDIDAEGIGFWDFHCQPSRSPVHSLGNKMDLSTKTLRFDRTTMMLSTYLVKVLEELTFTARIGQCYVLFFLVFMYLIHTDYQDQ